MTLDDATSLAFTVHGATWIATAAAYYRYGDRTDLFDKSLRGCRRTRQSIRDALATSLSAHLGPVVKDSARVRSAVLDAAGHFLDQQANLAESEPYYQAIRDFVSRSAGALVDYRLALDTVKLWKTWAHRLSKSILFLLVLETVMLGWTVIAVVSADLSTQASRWTLAVGSAPTTAIILATLCCLVMLNMNHGRLVDLKERYDPDS